MGSSIGTNNQRRCDSIKLEKKLGAHIWDQHLNMSIFNVYFFETYNVAKKYLTYEENYHAFFCTLAEEVVSNDLDSRPTRPPSWRTERSVPSPVPVRTLPAANICQTGNKKRLQHGRCTPYHNQRRCRICQMKTIWISSLCNVEGPDDEH